MINLRNVFATSEEIQEETRIGRPCTVVHFGAAQNHLGDRPAGLKYKLCLWRGGSMSAQRKRCLFAFCNFPTRVVSCLHSHTSGRIFFVICSTSSLKSNPVARTWKQVVYLGGDTRKHSEKKRVIQGGEKSVEFTLVSCFTLLATRAQFL